MPYQVYCHSCNVTFPTGTRRCLHCGSRTRLEAPHGGRLNRPAREMMAAPLDLANEVLAIQSLPDLPVSESALEPEAVPARRSLLRAGMTVLWMTLLAAGYAWRACSQQ